MVIIRRVMAGVIVCAAGFAAIFVGLDRVSAPRGAPADEAATSNAPSAPVVETAPAVVDPDLGNAANRGLRINQAGLAIIKESEGLRLEAYQSGGNWFIGYGHLGAEPGSGITEAEADRLLRQDVAGAEAGVKRLVIVPVNENEFSAMVSLAYNLGVGGFARSSVLERINESDRQGAADSFRNYARSGYQVLEHLKQRREKERTLFLTPA